MVTDGTILPGVASYGASSLLALNQHGKSYWEVTLCDRKKKKIKTQKTKSKIGFSVLISRSPQNIVEKLWDTWQQLLINPEHSW